MYKHNNKRFHRLALAAMLLLSTNLMAEESHDEYGSDIQPQNMAEEILAQGESALAQMTGEQHLTNDWQRAVLASLTSQLQQSSEALIAVKPVAALPSHERFLDTRTPNMASPTRLHIDTPELHFTLDDWQSLPGASEHLSQNKG